MSSLLLDKKMKRASDELNYMGCNIFREGQLLVHHQDEPSAAHATAKPPRSRKLAMLPLTHYFRDGSKCEIPAASKCFPLCRHERTSTGTNVVSESARSGSDHFILSPRRRAASLVGGGARLRALAALNSSQFEHGALRGHLVSLIEAEMMPRN
jgi:hypothetical protein